MSQKYSPSSSSLPFRTFQTFLSSLLDPFPPVSRVPVLGPVKRLLVWVSLFIGEKSAHYCCSVHRNWTLFEPKHLPGRKHTSGRCYVYKFKHLWTILLLFIQIYWSLISCSVIGQPGNRTTTLGSTSTKAIFFSFAIKNELFCVSLIIKTTRKQFLISVCFKSTSLTDAKKPPKDVAWWVNFVIDLLW